MVYTIQNADTLKKQYKMQLPETDKLKGTAKLDAILKPGTENSNDIHNKLNILFSRYTNITNNEINVLIQKTCGYNREQLVRLDSKTQDKVIRSLEAALQDCSKGKTINKERLARRFRAYNVMVIKGSNNIEEARKSIEEFKNMTLVDYLQKKGYLDKNVKNSDITIEQLENAIAKTLNEQCGNLKNKKPSEEEILKQRKIIERLIANTPEEEKAKLWKAFQNVISEENKCPAFDSMISSFVTPDKLQDFLHSIKPAELVAAGMPDKDVQKFSHLLSANLDEEGLKEHRAEIVAFMAAYYEANKDTLASLEKKIQAARAEGIEPELTEEEKALQEQINKFKRVETGNITGTASNNIITKDFKDEFLTTLINDVKENGHYEDVMGLVKEYSQEHPEEKLDDLMNTLTNNEYNDIKTPTEKKQEKTQNADIGFSERQVPADMKKLPILKEEVKQTEEKPERRFRVDKNITRSTQSKTISQEFAEAENSQAKRSVIERYFDKSPMLKITLEKYLANVTDPIIILNTLPSNARKYLANKLVHKGCLEEKYIEKLNMSIGDKQLLLNTFNETHKNKRV